MSNITITSHHLELTDAIKSYANKKMERLQKHFEQITSIHMLLKLEKNIKIAEATIHAKGHVELFAESQSDDLYAAIDLLADKLDRQVIKHKEKMQA